MREPAIIAPFTAHSVLFNQRSLDKFEREKLVDRQGLVPPTSDVTFHHFLQAGSFEVRPSEGAGVEQRVPHVWGQLVAIPYTKVMELMTTEKQPLEM